MTKFVFGGSPRRSYQIRALRQIIKNKGITALLMDPGTGKTAVALDYASILAVKNPQRTTRVLVICPLVAVDTWVIQAEQFVSPMVQVWAEVIGGSVMQKAMTLAARGNSPYRRHPETLQAIPSATQAEGWRRSLITYSSIGSSPSEGPTALDDRAQKLVIEVVNLDAFSQRRKIRSKTSADIMLDAVKRYDPHLVILDESHKIKGASSNVSRLMARISEVVPRRLILTGTVMPHSVLDVFGQWRFLEPYAFGRNGKRATFGGFKNRYAILGGWMGQEVVGFRDLDHMQNIMARNAVVVKKSEALDLPPTSDVIVPVHMSPRENKAYAEMKGALAAQLTSTQNVVATNRLTQMMRLRQITSGYLPDDQGQLHVIGRSKTNTIKSLVNDTLAGEKRVVVFCLFTHEIKELQTALAEKGTTVEVISGSTRKERRAEIRKRFGTVSDERIVLVAQITTLSLAVNELVTASHAVFASMSQRRDDYIQARDRLDRIGQTQPVTYWHVLAPATVDEVILQSHRERTDLETAMLDHIRKEVRT